MTTVLLNAKSNFPARQQHRQNAGGNSAAPSRQLERLDRFGTATPTIPASQPRLAPGLFGQSLGAEAKEVLQPQGKFVSKNNEAYDVYRIKPNFIEYHFPKGSQVTKEGDQLRVKASREFVRFGFTVAAHSEAIFGLPMGLPIELTLGKPWVSGALVIPAGSRLYNIESFPTKIQLPNDTPLLGIPCSAAAALSYEPAGSQSYQLREFTLARDHTVDGVLLSKGTQVLRDKRGSFQKLLLGAKQNFHMTGTTSPPATLPAKSEILYQLVEKDWFTPAKAELAEITVGTGTMTFDGKALPSGTRLSFRNNTLWGIIVGSSPLVWDGYTFPPGAALTFEDGQLRSAALKGPDNLTLQIGGSFLAPGSTLEFTKTSSPASHGSYVSSITPQADIKINGVPCAAGFRILLFENGQVASTVLAEDYTTDDHMKVPCARGAKTQFHENRQLHRSKLSRDYSTPDRMKVPCAEKEAIVFYDNYVLQEAFLAKNYTTQDRWQVPCAAKTKIAFYRRQNLHHATLASLYRTPVTKIPCAENTEISFYENYKLYHGMLGDNHTFTVGAMKVQGKKKTPFTLEERGSLSWATLAAPLKALNTTFLEDSGVSFEQNSLVTVYSSQNITVHGIPCLAFEAIEFDHEKLRRAVLSKNYEITVGSYKVPCAERAELFFYPQEKLGSVSKLSKEWPVKQKGLSFRFQKDRPASFFKNGMLGAAVSVAPKIVDLQGHDYELAPHSETARMAWKLPETFQSHYVRGDENAPIYDENLVSFSEDGGLLKY